MNFKRTAIIVGTLVFFLLLAWRCGKAGPPEVPEDQALSAKPETAPRPLPTQVSEVSLPQDDSSPILEFPPSHVPLPLESLQSPIGKANYTYHQLLDSIVTEDGLVNYDLFAKRKSVLQIGLIVKEYTKAGFPDTPKKQLALWCNAYNANVLFQVMMERSKPGFTTIDKIDGLFDKRPIIVASEALTLNTLENDRIRTMKDPRIHAALVCAAMSCPTLRNEPYRHDKIDAQLDEQCVKWVNDITKNRVVDGTLQISRIFNWYGSDFDVEPYGSVTGFLRHFADPDGELGKFLKANPSPPIEWMPYDWTLNMSSPN